MELRELLTTKNTFLDCKSPWMETLELPQRPSSDPGVSTDGTSAATSQAESSADQSQAALAGSLDAAGGESLRSAAARAWQQQRSSAAGAGNASGASKEGLAASTGSEPAQAAGEADVAFVPISKTRRRMMQRKGAEEIKARAAGSDSSSFGSSASRRRQPPAQDGLQLSEVVTRIVTNGSTQPQMQSTKISL